MGGHFGKAKQSAASQSVDYDKVREVVAAKLADPAWDDGSWGPVFVRLGWHAAGTYDKSDGSGGSDGGCIRHKPQSEWGFNKGLHHARQRLEDVPKQFPGLSYADLYSLASVVAIERMGGPRIPWRPARVDHADGAKSPPDGRLPDGTRDGAHLRSVFGRMGFNDTDIVALSGAHSLGRCHVDRSGFTGPWTREPTRFSNLYYKELLESTWTKKQWDGPPQWEDQTGQLMMLATDLALIEDPIFRPIVERYAKDEKAFFDDFTAAFVKLQENGVAALSVNDGDRAPAAAKAGSSSSSAAEPKAPIAAKGEAGGPVESRQSPDAGAGPSVAASDDVDPTGDGKAATADGESLARQAPQQDEVEEIETLDH